MSLAEITTDSFDREVLQSPGTVLVDFRTEWCPPCNRLAPLLEQLASDYAGRLKIVTVDIEKSRDLALRFKINAVPTLHIYRHGHLAKQLVGECSKPILLQALSLAPNQPTLA